MHTYATSVGEVKSAALDALRLALGGATTVALVNFPNHGNPGDPAIWLGTEQLLSDLGVRIAYRAAHWSFDPVTVRRRLSDGPILINGGGNFGDLYRGQQATREEIIRQMHDYPIVQLPQSIHFESDARARAMGDLMRQHGRVTLMVRDERSREIAHQSLGFDAVMSPDHVFGLGPIALQPPRIDEVLWLTWRSSAVEATAESEPPSDFAAHRLDWIEQAGSAHERFDATQTRYWQRNEWFRQNWEARRRLTRSLTPRLEATFAPLARGWLDAGLDILSLSPVVVTNKLHGHILCALAGKPHVVLDNSYGKVFGAVETYTWSLPGVHTAHTADEAAELARHLLETASAVS